MDQSATYPQASTPPPGPARSPRSAWTTRLRPRWLVTAIGALVVLFLGIGIGSAGADPSTPEPASTTDAVQAAQDQRQQELDTLAAQLDGREDALDTRDADLQAQATALGERSTELDTLAASLAQRETDVGARETAAAAASSSSGSKGSGSTKAAAAQPAAPAPAPAQAAPAQPAAPAPAPAQPAAPASVYYENCDAARAAGAAPVHVGDPGYRKALDRDNDGIGCE